MSEKRSHKKKIKVAKDAPITGPDCIQNAKVKHTYTMEELTGMGAELSEELQRIDELEEQKKNATAEFSNKIKISQAVSGSLANKIRTGYEMQDQKVMVAFMPDQNKKRLFDLETGGFIRDESMSAEDLQIGLPFIKGGEVDPSIPNPVIDPEVEAE